MKSLCCLVLVMAFAGEHTKDSLQTVKKNMADEKAVLVDVREKSEWDKGHVKGAILLPLSALRKDANAASKLPDERIIYTHCEVGKRSVTAAKILEKAGFEVRPLKEGYKDFIKAGFEPEK